MSILDRMKLTDDQKQLGEKLFQIWNNEHFVAGVLIKVKTKNEIETINKLIENTIDISPSMILAEALLIKNERDKN